MLSGPDSRANQNSIIIAAVIISAGLIIAALIIAKPGLLTIYGLAPISTASVSMQFGAQMQSQMAGKQTDLSGGVRTTLQDVTVERVEYLPEQKRYRVAYTLHWKTTNQTIEPNACYLKDNGTGKFVGECYGYAVFQGGRSYLQKPVPILIDPKAKIVM